MAPAPAFAGAWIAPENGQEIWTNTAGQREGVTFYETSDYWEIPLNSRRSFVAAPWFEQAPDIAEHGWRTEVNVGFKQALLRTDHTAMAVQAGAVWRSEPDRGCGDTEVELRWLGGVSQGRRFLNLEAAERVGAAGCMDQRFSVTAGYHASEHWLGLAELFTDAPSRGDTALKAQFSLVRLRDARKGIQVGVRTRVDGGAAEPALVIGFWGLPGR